MARRHVVSTEMMKVERKTPKGAYLGWGKYAIRKLTTNASSPKLLKYRGCVGGELSGKTFSDLKGVQEAFRDAAHACKARV